MALPEATSQDHHGLESFRVRGRIFATVPDDSHIRVMVEAEDTTAAATEYPDACAPFYWGDRLACVVVTVAAADPGAARGAVDRSLASQGAQEAGGQVGGVNQALAWRAKGPRGTLSSAR